MADAEFIFASGLEPEQRLEDLRPLAEAGVARGLPVICSNPDIVAVSAGELANAPGAFARIYEQLGGEVHFVGKPHAPIYEVCFDVLRGVPRSAIVGIGDSLEHDIKGASDAGIDSAFVTQGIHAAEFPPEASAEENVGALQQLCRESACPTWAIPRLVW